MTEETLFQFPVRPVERPRVGILGAGAVSAHHARALRRLPFVELAAVADPDKKRAEALAARFQIPGVYASLPAMAEAAPDVIHILTPPGSHAVLSLEALRMGCHVLVEAPMATNAADCEHMVAVANERGLLLGINHSALFEPVVIKALDFIRDGACGEVLGADVYCTSAYSPYGGGGPMPASFVHGAYPFQDLGVHGLYLVEALLGPVRHADIRYYPSGLGDPNLVFDEWRALLECERGPAQMYLSFNVRPPQNEIVVHGTRGVLHVDRLLQTLTLRTTYAGSPETQRVIGAGFTAVSAFAKSLWNAARIATRQFDPVPGIASGVRQFHESLHTGSAPPFALLESCRAAALLEDVSRRAADDKHRYLYETTTIPLPRILVTGAQGALGRALVRRLAEFGEPLRLLVRRPPASPPGDKIQLMYGDLGDPEVADRAVAGIDLVFHLAAARGGGVAEVASGTVWATRNIVDACERHSVRKLIHLSSLAVLDSAGHPPGLAVTERYPYEPYASRRGLYSQTKLEAERTVLQAVEENRIHAIVLRPGQIYGPGMPPWPPAGAFHLNGRWIVAGSGAHYVPLVYIENVIDALMLAAQKDLPNGSIFQLVDPEGIRQRDYIEMVRRSGHPLRASYVPVWLLKLLGLGAVAVSKLRGRPPALSPYRVNSLAPLWPCDCTAAHTQLGWTPRVGIHEGLALTYPAR